jgi:hypothetical protein
MASPDKIMLIRHAEKPASPPPAGVNENGDADKHSLIVRGWQRAGALVEFFENPARPGISRPATIFAATISNDATIDPDDSKSLRPAETVAPLVAKSGAIFRNDIPVGAEGQAIDAIKMCRGVVLVSWEHKRIPTIAAGFIANPPVWGDRFDAVWILDQQPDGSYVLSIVNQDLLSGDLPS